MGRLPRAKPFGAGKAFGFHATVAVSLLGHGCSPAISSPPDPAPGVSGSAQLVALPAGARVVQLALGDNHTCARLESGRVACWGDNGRGQLGNGSDQPSASPVLVPHVVEAVDIRASRATTCIRTKAGSVSCWGDNAYGQANPQFDAALTSAPAPWGAYDYTGEPQKFTPANVLRKVTPNPIAAGARSVSLGYGHGCGTYDQGDVKCWGDASHGQLGVAALPEAFQVQTIAGLPGLVEVSSALFYSCGRTADGRVWCWGANEQAQLGSAAPGPAPRQVPGITGAHAIHLAANRACAWLDAGQVMCWGDSLGCGEDQAHPPALVPELETDVQFARAAGECFWCVLGAGHALECDGDPIARVGFSMGNVSSVVAGIYHACATKFDGSVWCWGGNPNGELGRKTADVKDPEPAPVIWTAEGLQPPKQ